jgi:hypothetical protein
MQCFLLSFFSAVQNCEQRKLEDEFLAAATEGIVDVMKDIVIPGCILEMFW